MPSRWTPDGAARGPYNGLNNFALGVAVRGGETSGSPLEASTGAIACCGPQLFSQHGDDVGDTRRLLGRGCFDGIPLQSLQSRSFFALLERQQAEVKPGFVRVGIGIGKVLESLLSLFAIALNRD